MKKGYTLAEVLIVICIFGIIISLMLPSIVQKSKQNSIQNTVKQQVETIKNKQNYDYDFSK